MPDDCQPSSILCAGCPMKKPLKFAGKLNAYRQMKGLTIARLSAIVGVDADTMERLLAGQNAPNAANLTRITRGLDIMFEPDDFEEVA